MTNGVPVTVVRELKSGVVAGVTKGKPVLHILDLKSAAAGFLDKISTHNAKITVSGFGQGGFSEQTIAVDKKQYT